ncbi:hypothetical protein PHLCEN_2v800 [Hermanssonia centrifuga]|uniref:Sm domain-containing protein n=1 Tax=Hermanssonia centrifuga TaxID=98765 RepID=A0A2R6S4Z8_9APHY|nr:hypothetical protein PHLCEN_2v800 [Hermanssonia centrifuga]
MSSGTSSSLSEHVASLNLQDRGEDTPAIQSLKSLLRQSLRITILDGRIFLGTFAGTDKQLNILLINTDEFRLAPRQHINPDGRFVGLVLIPWRLVVKVEVHKPQGDDAADADNYRMRGMGNEEENDSLYAW